MRISIDNEQAFFSIVQTSPDLIEVDGMLRAAIDELKFRMAELFERGNSTPEMLALSRIRERVKAEIHRINLISDQVRWGKVVKEVLGQQAYEECLLHMRIIQDEHMQHVDAVVKRIGCEP